MKEYLTVIEKIKFQWIRIYISTNCPSPLSIYKIEQVVT